MGKVIKEQITDYCKLYTYAIKNKQFKGIRMKVDKGIMLFEVNKNVTPNKSFFEKGYKLVSRNKVKDRTITVFSINCNEEERGADIFEKFIIDLGHFR